MKFCSILILPAVVSSLFGGDAAEPAADVRKLVMVKADRTSGRLVRTVTVQPRVIKPMAVKPVDEKSLNAGLKTSSDPAVNDLVENAAKRHSVDPLLVHSVIQVESGYNKYAVSPKGAQGLMQLIPSTAQRFGVRNAFDPKENIEAGVRYLKFLQDTFGDDRLALAAYNAGEGAVSRYGWIPPYQETQDYVYKVGAKYGAARRAAEKTKQVAVVPEQPKKVEEHVDAEGRVHLLLR